MAKSKKIVAIQKDLLKLIGYGQKERINETYLCKKNKSGQGGESTQNFDKKIFFL
jgi:hypothetical protein